MHVRRLAILAALATTTSLLVATPARAHIDPDPVEAQAGMTVSVGFTVEHGCEDSPTVQLDMRLPDGITDATPEPPAGWTGSLDQNIVTFSGGPLPDDQPMTFRVRLTLPPTPDTTIYFPFVQRCEIGEIRWIDIPDDNETGAELDQPAPAMALFGPVAAANAPTTTTSTPPTTNSPTTTTAVPTTTTEPEPIATGTTQDIGSPTTDQPAPVGLASESDATDDDGTGSTGTVVFVLVLVAIGALTALVVVQARRRRP